MDYDDVVSLRKELEAIHHEASETNENLIAVMKFIGATLGTLRWISVWLFLLFVISLFHHIF